MVAILARKTPQPIPAIHPLPEYLADGELATLYLEMKTTLQVPWMGVVTMAYAHYPEFFRVLWQGLKPIVGSAVFVRHCQELRQGVERGVLALEPPPIAQRLFGMGYAPRECEQIRHVIEVFSHGNFAYLLIATLVRLLLNGEDLRESHLVATPFSGRHAPSATVPLVLMEPHHADADTRAVYDDVRRTLGLPFVNTDYRALARWPSYFSLAWADLKPQVNSSAYAALCEQTHREAIDRVLNRLPNPEGLRAAALQAAAAHETSLDELRRVAELFQWLLPGLVTHIAFFRAQLAAP
ncbi:MAG: hypothetical protein JXR43_03770 [Burkholderiaceae bacterium]|nr:hypothetical protein [Burkholderiaceae bacterium]